MKTKSVLFAFMLLSSCGSSNCKNQTIKCTAINDKILMTDNERYEASDLFYLLTFDSCEDRTYVYGCEHYYTKYNVTVDQKIKGSEDISFVYIMIDFNSCVSGIGAGKEIVTLGQKYYVYLKWYNPLNGYETTEKMHSIIPFVEQ